MRKGHAPFDWRTTGQGAHFLVITFDGIDIYSDGDGTKGVRGLLSDGKSEPRST